MNAFAMLDTSDNEEEVVVSNTKKPANGGAKAPTKTDASKKTVEGKVSKENNKTSDKPKESEKKSTIPAKAPSAATLTDVDGGKENNRGGRARGKEGNKRGEKKYENGAKKDESNEGKKEKREFERRSGTGRGREVSRGGRGPYNSGNVNQEAQNAEKNPDEELLDASPIVDDEEGNDSSNVVAEPEEPKVKTVSIDDYLRQKEEARASSKILSSQQSVRAVSAQGGERLSTKVQEDSSTNGKNADRKVQNEPVKSTVFELGFKFNSPSSAPRPPRVQEGDRPQRGRGDGRRPAGGRGDKRQMPSVSINQAEFPDLK